MRRWRRQKSIAPPSPRGWADARRQLSERVRRGLDALEPTLDEELLRQVRFRANVLLEEDQPAAVFLRSVYALPPHERDRLRQSWRFRSGLLRRDDEASRLLRELIDRPAPTHGSAPAVCRECGTGAGLHTADCPLVAEAVE